MARRRRTHRGSAAVALCTAAGLMAASGCGGDGAAVDGRADAEGRTAVDRRTGVTGGAAAEGRTPGDPAQAVRRAAAVLARAGGARVRTSMEMATGGTRVTIDGEGVYDFRRGLGRLLVVLPQDPAGQVPHRPITELLAPGALYMKNRGAGVPADKWVRIETSSMSDGNLVTGGATDPLTAVQLLGGARDVAYAGRAEAGGVAVRHYRGTAVIREAALALPARERGPLLAAAKGFSNGLVPFDVYLDEDGRVRRLRHQFSYDAGREQPVAVASTTFLDAFGVPAEVRLPRPEDIYSGQIAE